jgi:hypothetical protein
MVRKESWVLKVLLVGISIIFTLGVLEIGLRIINFPHIQTAQNTLFTEYDPTLGWKNTPGADGYLTSSEYDVHLQYNSRGMRGPVFPYDKPQGTYRVVVLGDSFIDGYSVNQQDRVTEDLSSMLAKQLQRPVDVIPMGVAGYSNDQELLWLESEGFKYHPDLVILMFYDNDIMYNTSDSYFRGGKPVFKLNGSDLTLTNVPVPPPTADSSSPALITNIKDWFKSFRLYILAKNTLHNIPWLYNFAIKVGIAKVPPADTTNANSVAPMPYEFLVYQKNPGSNVTYAWNVTAALIERMKQESANNGAAFLAFHIPFTASVYQDQWNNMKRAYGYTDNDWAVSEVTRNFLEICSTESIQCLDPTDEFIQAASTLGKENQRLYYVDDPHWNANGHHLGAQILEEYILANKSAVNLK